MLLAAIGAVVPSLGVLAFSAPPAGAAPSAPTFTDTTPGEQQYSVPVNAAALLVTVIGGGANGFGGEVQATIPVPAGASTLFVEVGSGGGGSMFGGQPGGGESAIQTCMAGSGGCTYTADPASDPRLVVAGGGGGVGEGNFVDGSGGGPGGNAGQFLLSDTSGAGGAGVGTSPGGAGGDAGYTTGTGSSGAAGPADCMNGSGGTGSPGQGGTGGDNDFSNNGGGGGGGWVGGSGGGTGGPPGFCTIAGTSAGGGGGAGLSFVESSATNVTVEPAGIGQEVIITPIAPAAPAFSSPSSSTFVVGQSGTFTVSASGVPTPAFNESGNLPTGVGFQDNGNGTASISGLPGAGQAGSYPFTITASNGFGADATQDFTLNVNEAPAITSDPGTTFTAGQAATPFTITTAGTPTATVSESGPLPSGVNFTNIGDGTATLDGTPDAGTGGTYPITLVADNGVAPDATQTFTLTIDQAPAISTGAATTFQVGHAGTFTVATTGVPNASLSDGGAHLPSGVLFTNNGNGTATLAGTPAAGSGGVYAFTITASNEVGENATEAFTLTVVRAPVINSLAAATFTVGHAGTTTITTVDYPAAGLSESGALPMGVHFTDNGNGTATLAGTPAAGSGGSYNLVIVADNGVAPDATQAYTLTVDQALAIITPASTVFQRGQPGTFTVTATGFPGGSHVTLSDGNGALPQAIIFTDRGNGSATIAGTPALNSGGTYPLTITASNGVAPVATQAFTLSVVGPTLCTQRLPAGTVIGMATTADGRGYWIADHAGVVSACGDAPILGQVAGKVTSPVVAITATPSGHGFWLATAAGQVIPFGDAHSYGDVAGHALTKPIVAMAADPATGGYWLLGGDGGVFSFHAPFFGSTGGLHLNAPAVAMTANKNGSGYYFAATDGGVFTFGRALFHGSAGGIKLNKPVVGIALDPATGGYWLDASDGGIFAYGAPFLGSTGNIRLAQPCVGMSVYNGGTGYRFVAADGGIFSFHAPFEGSAT